MLSPLNRSLYCARIVAVATLAAGGLVNCVRAQDAGPNHGALLDDLSVGDVVVGMRTVEHDYQNKFNERPLPNFAGAPTAIDSLKRVSSSPNSFQVHFGTIASGDEDVIDSAISFVRKNLRSPKALR